MGCMGGKQHIRRLPVELTYTHVAALGLSH